MFPNIEISVPISPKMTLLIHHDKPLSRGIKNIDYVDVSAGLVDAFNRRTAVYADEYVVASRSNFDAVWLPSSDGEV